MPSATAGGWPYPLPTEPVRDGAVNIQNLANKAQSRLGNQAILALFFSGAFDVNGLYYAPTWASQGVTFSATPIVLVTPLQTAIGGDAGINVQIYQPQTNVSAAVFQANYVKDGRNYNGTLGIYVIAIGPGERP